MMRIIVTGANGRMGSSICALAQNAADLSVSAKVSRTIPLETVIQQGDVVIDFTMPDGSITYAKIAAAHGTPIVIGTTGFTDQQQAVIGGVAAKIPIVFSPNMSIGVNVLFSLASLAAHALGDDFSIDIAETHHVHKKDKPSGTAKKIRDVILAERKTSADIPIHSIRKGEIVGDHTVTFTNPRERVTIGHHAVTRDIFAEGALVAARWIIGKRPGLYTMADVLGL